MLHAISRKDGVATWTFTTKARIDPSPVIVGDRVVSASGDGKLYILDLATGDLVWDFDTGSSFLASPGVADNRIVIGTDEGLVYCFASE